jgi:hypothetical protein
MNIKRTEAQFLNKSQGQYELIGGTEEEVEAANNGLSSGAIKSYAVHVAVQEFRLF